ncbi:L-rhamnose mutarotase [Pelomyxa schiedti]|nr:L-rhamnose mutarotase [Pelomyxa schiedti]
MSSSNPKPYIRKAFKMTVNNGSEAEYQQRHSPIWPELEAVLKSHGAHNYSIFLDRQSGTLFGYVEIESEELWDQIATTPECKRWWAHMSDIMPSNPDHSPVSSPLEQVFHME